MNEKKNNVKDDSTVSIKKKNLTLKPEQEDKAFSLISTVKYGLLYDLVEPEFFSSWVVIRAILFRHTVSTVCNAFEAIYL